MRLRFADFVVDSATRQVLRDQEDIHLSPKAFDLLWTLVERRPSVVDKAELVTRIWPNTYVGEANLNVLIGEIRRALGDLAQRPRFIRTVHGVGYAFCGEVAEVPRPTTQRRPAATRCWLVWNDHTYTLAEGDNLIGRDPGSGIWLDESGVSRRHARIHIDAARRRMTLEDLNSTNGTFVGETQLSAKHALADGEVIHIGSVALTFRAWFPETSRETERIRRKPRPK